MSAQTPFVDRRTVIAQARRLVLKVGSQLLADVDGVPMNTRIDQLLDQIAALRERGIEVILVSSGAIASGLLLTGELRRPRELPRLQALAALGQSQLMSLYQRAAVNRGFHCAQMLLTADDLRDRKRHLNACNCLHELLSARILPVINENDTVCVDELSFGDNDRLAALVATMVRADLTILLTPIEGLRQRLGEQLGERCSLVTEITDEVRALARGTDGNRFSTGGMKSKIEAADIAVSSGEPLWIADGRDFRVLAQIMAGDDVGTLFLPSKSRLRASKRFVAFFTDAVGELAIDEGAVQALRERGKSLLPSGITGVVGTFEKGDTLRLVDPAGQEIGLGISNYASDELAAIKGRRSEQLAEVLPEARYTEAIHRDNLVIW